MVSLLFYVALYLSYIIIIFEKCVVISSKLSVSKWFQNLIFLYLSLIVFFMNSD